MTGRREMIAAKAYEMMGDFGLESVHARTVASELEINHATVHYYFPKRVDLLLGVAEQALYRLNLDRTAFYEDATTAHDRLMADVELAEAYGSKGSRFYRVVQGLFVASLGEPKLRPAAQKIYKAYRDGLATQLEGAKVKKRSPYSDADLLAATLIGAGLVSQLHDGKGGSKLIQQITDSIEGTGTIS